MEISDKIYIAVQNVLSFLTGGTECISCGKKTYALPLCKECRNEFLTVTPFKSEERCSVCGKELVSEIGKCSECNEESERFLDALFPIHMYRLWKKDLLFAWKSQGQRSLSLFFASVVKAAIDLLKDCSVEFDSIIPVPPRPGKIKKKGWDQVDELVKILEKKFSLKAEYVLERVSSVEQKSLNKGERKGSLGAKYQLKSGAELNAKRCLILDDVITTGSTMEKCAKLLKKAGAEEVYGLSLFMVD